jgi:hypothetical protein
MLRPAQRIHGREAAGGVTSMSLMNRSIRSLVIVAGLVAAGAVFHASTAYAQTAYCKDHRPAGGDGICDTVHYFGDKPKGKFCVDADMDNYCDVADNCSDVSNPDQFDSNGDGFGNACDADFDNDGSVTMVDHDLLLEVIFSHEGDGFYDTDCDMDGDGVIGIPEWNLLRTQFAAGVPGPSGPKE